MDRLAALPGETRREILAGLPEELLAQLPYVWELWARSERLEPPREWRFWLMRSGRGAGKTRAASETLRSWVEHSILARLHLVGAPRPTCATPWSRGPQASWP